MVYYFEEKVERNVRNKGKFLVSENFSNINQRLLSLPFFCHLILINCLHIYTLILLVFSWHCLSWHNIIGPFKWMMAHFVVLWCSIFWYQQEHSSRNLLRLGKFRDGCQGSSGPVTPSTSLIIWISKGSELFEIRTIQWVTGHYIYIESQVSKRIAHFSVVKM